MQNALEHNPWDYQEFMDSSPEGSVGAPEGVQPNPNSGPTGKDPVENALSLGSFLPGLGGDFLGPLSELRAMQQDPSKRTLANLALFGVGALPAVPSLMWMMNRASDNPIRRGLFSNQSGVLGYHGTRNPDFKNEEFNPLSHFGSRPQAANERLGVHSAELKNYILMTPEFTRSHNRKVDLNIQNPLRIRDHGGNHDSILEYLILTREVNGINDREYQALQDIYNHYSNVEYGRKIKGYDLAEEKTREALIKNLRSKGYDGFVYENRAEDAGKDSYVIFDSSQVHQGFGKTTSAFGDILNKTQNEKPIKINQPYYVVYGLDNETEKFFNTKSGALDYLKELQSKNPTKNYEWDYINEGDK